MPSEGVEGRKGETSPTEVIGTVKGGDPGCIVKGIVKVAGEVEGLTVDASEHTHRSAKIGSGVRGPVIRSLCTGEKGNSHE